MKKNIEKEKIDIFSIPISYENNVRYDKHGKMVVKEDEERDFRKEYEVRGEQYPWIRKHIDDKWAVNKLFVDDALDEIDRLRKERDDKEEEPETYIVENVIELMKDRDDWKQKYFTLKEEFDSCKKWEFANDKIIDNKKERIQQLEKELEQEREENKCNEHNNQVLSKELEEMEKELENYKKVIDDLEQGLKDAGNNKFREQLNRFGINTAINLLKELKSKYLEGG